MTGIAVRLHVMTDCDSISSFFGKGKKCIWKQVEKSKEAQDLLRDLSEDSLRKFTIRYIYSDKGSESLAEMRRKK